MDSLRTHLSCQTRLLSDPGPLLSLLPDAAPVCWVRDGEGLVGWGEVARVEVSGPDQFSQAQRWWDRFLTDADVPAAGFGPVAFVSLGFSADDVGVIVVPEVVVRRVGSGHWVTSWAADPVVTQQVRPPAPGQVSFASGAVPGPQWLDTVAAGIAAIDAGRVAKVVLARDEFARCESGFDARHVLRQVSRDYPRCWAFHVDGLVGATPELLVRKAADSITSRVLAGTVRRHADGSGDAQLAQILQSSAKDVVEHRYAVESVVSALAAVTTAVAAPADPFVLTLRNVLHLATDVHATSAPNVTVLTVAQHLHPTAAVCGTPTAAAAEVIAEVEGMARGRYTGAVGWLDAHGDGELGIALRCAELGVDGDPRQARLFAGCGIMAESDPLAELAESEAKFAPMRQALQ